MCTVPHLYSTRRNSTHAHALSPPRYSHATSMTIVCAAPPSRRVRGRGDAPNIFFFFATLPRHSKTIPAAVASTGAAIKPSIRSVGALVSLRQLARRPYHFMCSAVAPSIDMPAYAAIPSLYAPACRHCVVVTAGVATISRHEQHLLSCVTAPAGAVAPSLHCAAPPLLSPRPPVW